jgi:hypothetical protein
MFDSDIREGTCAWAFRLIHESFSAVDMKNEGVSTLPHLKISVSSNVDASITHLVGGGKFKHRMYQIPQLVSVLRSVPHPARHTP